MTKCNHKNTERVDYGTRICKDCGKLITTLDAALDAVIAEAIAEHEAKKVIPKCLPTPPLACDYCGCHPSVIYRTHKGNLCAKCNGIG